MYALLITMVRTMSHCLYGKGTCSDGSCPWTIGRRGLGSLRSEGAAGLTRPRILAVSSVMSPYAASAMFT